MRGRRSGGLWARRLGTGALACGMAAGNGLLRAQQPGGDPGAAAGQSQSQDQGAQGGRRGGQFAGMQRAEGEVTAVSGATVTVRNGEGQTVQIVTTDNTRVMKDRGQVKVSDLHVGDGLMAFGNLDPATHSLHAGIIMAEDAAQVKAMRENLGKTYITGRVTAVDLDDAKLTVERPDHVKQTIGFDETTSFKRAVRGARGGTSEGAGGGSAAGTGASGTGAAGTAGGGGGRGYGGGGMGMGGDPSAGLERAFANGESITLADIKVGDSVAGTGSLKGGTFVPLHLVDSPPRRPRSGTDGAGATGATGTAGAAGAGSPGPGGA